jgi:ribosome maturation factor RimP
MTPLEVKITDIITPVIRDMGLSLVSVKIIGEGGGRNLQVMAEDPATRNLGVDKCAEVSRSISAILDVEDVIEGAYRLEVSSPGIDRVLTKPEDFKEWAGFEARLETEMPLATGQKRFKGVLKGIENNIIRINTDQGEAEIPFGNLIKAKLVLTDELIKATAKT